MKVFMIGGTGLLGSEAAQELIARGHQVSSIALPPMPTGAQKVEGMELTFGNYLEMRDDELAACMRGCDGVVFAAGVDERVEGPAPIYDLYRRYNIDPLRRCLQVAQRVGVRHVAICGSYFAHFAKIWPEKHLTQTHPYIRSRVDQEQMALSFAHDGMDVAVLELPYIFGAQPGRKPVWMFLTQMIRSSKGQVFYPRGGTAMVTTRQVGQALADALERTHGGVAWPIGWDNMTWEQMLAIFMRHMGLQKKVVTIPDWLYAAGSLSVVADQRRRGIQGGLDMARFAPVMCAQTYIDKSLGCVPLGVREDDIDEAIGESVRLCMQIENGEVQAQGMRGE